MATPGGRSEPGGESPQIHPAGPDAGEHRRPAPRRGIAAQVIASLVLLTGLWVAISPRFIPLQQGGTNTASDVTIGLVVAVVGALALVRRHGFPRPQFASLVLGVWVVLLSSFTLDTRAAMSAPLDWSNTWAGAALAVLALTELAKLQRLPGDHSHRS